ncbi:methylated-DNA--[protein]-cysteine S-methyltransferase [Clostridium swellfunianum]|uniref:methylated-DNA--[protein]-cysteine S-methyltransferase n=1 Tax=Clostridium swellfunianum TaxID=1367462 RepID=UPI00202E63FA|nr:methylated-DNA--[protein]-cysteine S-methyltransferase [Clostridium swellfunianum]MCM0648777.1 methylated-DNA--[protein]-cysteine S-methyltransferase [Clostridium swellfunianum]
MKLYYDSYDCLIGRIYIVSDELGARNIEIVEEKWQEFASKNDVQKSSSKCYDTLKQVDEYFLGKRRNFELRLSIEGTEFRKRVWKELMNIPYGEVISYSQLAEAIGNPKAVRAVGQANRANPLPIIVPCHRVVGKDKSLVGYAGTRTDIKDKLLKLEGIIL